MVIIIIITRTIIIWERGKHHHVILPPSSSFTTFTGLPPPVGGGWYFFSTSHFSEEASAQLRDFLFKTFSLADRFLKTLFIDETLGIVSTLQMPSLSNLSLISQANIDGHSVLYLSIVWTTELVATLGFDPPIALGLIDPVS